MSETRTPGQLAYEAAMAMQDASMLCACDSEATPLCVACECRFSLIAAATRYAYEWHWRSRGRIPPPTWTPQEPPHA
jgi:hypothetical protein